MDSESESKLIALITQLMYLKENRDWGSKFLSVIIQIITLVRSMDLDLQPKPESKLMSLVTQTISLFKSLDLDSHPKPLSKLISLVSKKILHGNSDEFGFDSELWSSLYQSMKLEPEPELMSLIHQIISLVVSMDNSKRGKLISLCPQVQVSFDEGKLRFHVDEEVKQESSDKWLCLPMNWNKFSLSGEDITHFFCRGCKGKNHKECEEAPVEIKHSLHPGHSLQLVTLEVHWRTRDCCCCVEDLEGVFYYCPTCDYAMNIACVYKSQVLYDLESESTLISLITQLISINDILDPNSELEPKFISLITKIFSRVSSLNLASQAKPESKLVSLVKQTTILFNSMDFDSLPKPLSDLISVITQLVNYEDPDLKYFKSVMLQTLELRPEPELLSFIHQILSHVSFMSPEWEKLSSVFPQVKVVLEKGKFHLQQQDPVLQRTRNKWLCFPRNYERYSLAGEKVTHFLCRNCYGKNHEEYGKTRVVIKSPLHPKHSLQLALHEDWRTRKCYCGDAYLEPVFYYCSACDFAVDIACVEKPPKLYIDDRKWHEHTLTHFPRRAPIACDLCALPNSTSSPIYMCLPCDFVVHQSCLKLPRVIRISRHSHRISFSFSFDQGDWFCGVCRRKIDNVYGGYSCIKEDCSYAAHSKCATKRNVWDGNDLEGIPEEVEEEVEPFVRIRHGIIQHFSHQHHHLRLDEDKGRDYDDNRMCQACVTPIYFGNFYSCVECEYILHETCANLSRKIYHPIHPHLLTLVEGNNHIVLNHESDENSCSACPYYCGAGFFYECGKEGCLFRLHVQCATISEPLDHGSHMHPLFLTSEPEEQRRGCSVCQGRKERSSLTNETFNCIESECDFALCFKCATIPEKVRYKHDKHVLTLSYGDEETSTLMNWCEACEGKIYPEERFYKCDEYCCVTLHIHCLIGEDLYMKPGTSWTYWGKKVNVLSNNQHMSRPICSMQYCKKRCPYKIVFQRIDSGSIICSEKCMRDFQFRVGGA